MIYRQGYIKRIIEKVSFDYDGVLTTKEGISLFKRKITEGYDVYIITARNEGSQDVLDFASANGLPLSKVYFTSGVDKWHIIKDLGINKHYDNNAEQVDKINEYTDCEAILVDY